MDADRRQKGYFPSLDWISFLIMDIWKQKGEMGGKDLMGYILTNKEHLWIINRKVLLLLERPSRENITDYRNKVCIVS